MGSRPGARAYVRTWVVRGFAGTTVRGYTCGRRSRRTRMRWRSTGSPASAAEPWRPPPRGAGRTLRSCDGRASRRACSGCGARPGGRGGTYKTPATRTRRTPWNPRGRPVPPTAAGTFLAGCLHRPPADSPAHLATPRPPSPTPPVRSSIQAPPTRTRSSATRAAGLPGSVDHGRHLLEVPGEPRRRELASTGSTASKLSPPTPGETAFGAPPSPWPSSVSFRHRDLNGRGDGRPRHSAAVRLAPR